MFILISIPFSIIQPRFPLKRNTKPSPEFSVLWVLSSIKSFKGTLSKDDDYGIKNVGKKMNLCFFKPIRVYLDPLNMSNAGGFAWSWILKDFIQVQKEGGKFVVVCPRSP